MMEEQEQADEPMGVVIANEPGTGKTSDGLLLVNQAGGLMLTLNAIVDAVVDEHAEMYGETGPPLQRLEGKYTERDETLEGMKHGETGVVNVEFARGLSGTRLKAVNRLTSGRMLAVDEGQLLTHRSEQTDGINAIESSRRMVMSATPVSRPTDLLRLM